MVFFIINKQAIKNEQQINLHETGGGITLIKEGNKKTLFFIPSSEEMATEELYGSWLKDIHDELSVNIIVPPFDTEGFTPYLWEQNSSTSRKSATTDFLFAMYSDQMGIGHSISIVSTGDGSLQALDLAKKYSSIEKIILISPIHNSAENREGTIFHKLSGLPLVHYLVPWLPEYFGKARTGSYDILNDKLNEQFKGIYGKYYPAYMNLSFKRKVQRDAEKQMQDLNTIGPNRFFIIYGDDDLSYGLEGFERMGDALTDGGSEVSIIRVPQSGRMILFDNGRERIIDLISILLQ